VFAHSVACVGIATLDLVHRVPAFPKFPVKVRAEAFEMNLGGMAAAAACAIARLGGSAQFWGPIGDDAFGDTIRALLRANDVEASPVAPIAGATSSHSVVIVDNMGERLIINHRGSALDVSVDAVSTPPQLNARAVLADVRWASGAHALLDRANALGIPSVLDAEVGDVEALRALVPRARHVIFSEPGFAQWADAPCDSSQGQDRLRMLCDEGAALAAVTCGARGVRYATHEGSGRQPAFAVTVVDTLGAGDVFHGAYALAIAEGRSIAESLCFASAAAAIKCTRSGGPTAMPNRSELQEFLAQRSTSV
jgi:sulfofructose kinase